MSEFTFETYILFVGSVSGALRKDSSLTVFGIENAKDTAVNLIKEGLIEEGNKKEYIDSSANNFSGGSNHKTLHTADYYDTVNSQLRKAESRQDALDILHNIFRNLSNGTF